MDQYEKCDKCVYKDKDENCMVIVGCLGSRTPCNYIKSCDKYKEKKSK